MIIKGKNLRMYYKDHKRGFIVNLKEIESEQYGYDLKVGQKIEAIRYEHTNRELYFNCKIENITSEGITFTHYGSFINECQFVPWVKEFEVPSQHGIVQCDLYLEPCDILYEKNTLKDILKGNVEQEDTNGRGIWHQHGGRRALDCVSDRNLKNFIKLGQIEIKEI